ncbi:ABC transporter permease [Leucobacter sp. W1478]|uniref:ABC transporter permease n=1 Tax=Leucobacter sp. W1478 TaxID=3439065 RepID=UPI003F307F78
MRAADSGLPDIIDTLLRARVLQLTLNTVALTLAVTGTCLVIGGAMGIAVSRARLPGGRVWLLVAALPLAVPSYLAAYGWLVFAPGFSGFLASWLVMSAVCVPYVVLPVAAVMRNVSGDLEAVARSLGRGPFGAFRVATWPRVRPAALAGSLLVALYTLSDFGAVSMLRFQTLTWGIKSAYGASFDRHQAALLALVLVALALTVVIAERQARRSTTVVAGRRTPARPARPALLPVILAGVLLSPILAVAVPMMGLVAQLAQAETIRGVDVPRLLGAIGTTLGLALAGSLFAVALALPIALLAAKYRGRLVNAIESIGYLGHALPGIVVGLSLVFFSLAVLPSLYQTVTMLIFAYAVLFMSKSIGSTRSGIAAVPVSLIDVSRTLGLSPLATWWRVTWRLASPAIGVGALLVGIAIMKELPATLLLRPTGISTLAVELWNRTGVLEFGSAAPYAAALVLLAAVPAFFLSGIRGAQKEEP